MDFIIKLGERIMTTNELPYITLKNDKEYEDAKEARDKIIKIYKGEEWKEKIVEGFNNSMLSYTVNHDPFKKKESLTKKLIKGCDEFIIANLLNDDLLLLL